MKADEAELYVTLVEAAREIDESPDVLRRAMKRKEIRAVKENPANKRSRWLVALEDVKRLYGSVSDDGAEIPSEIDADGRAAIDRGSAITSVEESTANDQETVPDPNTAVTGMPDVAIDHQSAMEPRSRPMQIEHEGSRTDRATTPGAEMPRSVPSNSADEAGSTALESADTGDPMQLPVPTRGEDLVERLTDAVDRLAENLPTAPFDYQALLDKYVAAVERAAEAEVEVATWKRRIDDRNDQLATAIDQLDEAYAENRRLLTELDSTRSDLAASSESRSGTQNRPLWKRRDR